MLKIGQLAQQGEVSVPTLRYYESQGLLEPPTRAANGYRLYAEEALQRVRFIRRSQGLGFSLKEIEELLLLQVDASQHSCREVKQVAEDKLGQVRQRIDELQQIERALETLADKCCGGPEVAAGCSILRELSGQATSASGDHNPSTRLNRDTDS
ncbi:Zn(2+)-responsive transcriptional regulator [Aestuariirhabdus sp. Z084]|uniref:Zn(2+)-responsive transcriptional regulator n=1 Tax=Aestuariirhabdus haliotis TaxID=2918751 RepID=UPI00201B36EA|nr:Zn(2+)-responsive transcriptional regulator [Aestuariirhabdus haliotis]MCL6414116.1 Zn(2+)-responsive transcriptional regulator [Aestuariirhabdus haliotis]MCL6418048.1 Zn(2+)-responsive transcriptional regulator [Aestuariirhabdus haliotis]